MIDPGARGFSNLFFLVSLVSRSILWVSTTTMYTIRISGRFFGYRTISAALYSFCVIRRVLEASARDSGTFHDRSFPRSQSSYYSTFTERSTICEVYPGTTPHFLTRTTETTRSVSAITRPSTFQCTAVSLISQGGPSIIRIVRSQGKEPDTQGIFSVTYATSKTNSTCQTTKE